MMLKEEKLYTDPPVNLVLLYCPTRSGHYGLGTHIGNLVPFLQKQPNIKLTIVKTDDINSTEINCEFNNNTTFINIPSAQHKQQIATFDNLFQKRYGDRIAQIIEFHLNDKENLLFWVNSIDYLNVCYSLKALFEGCKIMYVHHAWSWKNLMNIPDEKFSEKWRSNTINNPIVVELTNYQIKIAQLADLVVTVSKYSTDLFLNTFDIPLSKIKLIFNGVAISNAQKPSRHILRRKYGFSDDDKIILFSGRMKPQKGLPYLIGAFKLLAEERKDLRLLVVGDGDFDDYAPLANPYWNRVTYTGEMEPEQVTEMYTMADIGVMPSIFEECGYTAIEMRFHKLPAIVSSVDGLDDMFEDRFDALKLKVYEDEEGKKMLKESDIALSIATLLDDSELCSILTKNAYEKAINRFSQNTMCEHYYEAILSLMQHESKS